jgi:chromosome segregation ATPase
MATLLLVLASWFSTETVIVALISVSGTIILGLIGIYTTRVSAKTTRQASSEENQTAYRKALGEEANSLIQTAVDLSKGVREELERVRTESEAERVRLREELSDLRRELGDTRSELEQTRISERQLREQMVALQAELREYRNGGRDPQARTRWDDEGEDGST